MTPSQQTPEAKTLRDEVWKAIVGYENEPDPDQVLEAVMLVVSDLAKGCLEAVPDDIAEEISATFDINLIEYPGWVAARKALLSFFRSKGVEAGHDNSTD